MATFLNNSLSAIILAGGKSSRMGYDKALIEFHGVPLIQRTTQLVQSYVDAVYLITPWIERYRFIVSPSCHLIRETQRQGEPQGPFVGFAQALTYVKTEWVFLLACDLPNLTATEIARWVTHLNDISDKAIAYLPRHPKGWEPLCGFYRSSCLNALEAYIDAGGCSFQPWLKTQSVVELPVSDPHILFNCNTPTDLSRLLSP